MASETGICNLALAHLGISKAIADLTERSKEANLCNQFYESTRDLVLRDFAWPFATKFVTLALVEEDPTDEWSFSYRYPVDCLKFRRILSGLRNDNRQSRVPIKIGQDDAGQLIYCDIEDAEAEYTIQVEDAGKFPPDFVMALSLRLASYIAPALTGGDPFKLGERAYRAYRMEIAAAQGNAGNEEQNEEHPEAEMIRARE